MVFNLHANFQSVPYFSLTDLSEKFTVLWLQRQQPPGTVCLHSILMLQTATLGCVIKALTPDPLRCYKTEEDRQHTLPVPSCLVEVMSVILSKRSKMHFMDVKSKQEWKKKMSDYSR